MIRPSRAGSIETALRALFPKGVAVAVCELAVADADALGPAERSALIGAVPHRIAEFAAGRQAARQALGQLGYPPCPLPMGADRAPLWPEGIVGSIAHASGIAVAAVRIGAPLGVDVEEDSPLAADLWPIILGPEEQDQLPQGDRGRLIRLVFAAKEAVFKAQATGRRAMFGFDAVAVTLADGKFDAQFRSDAGAFRAGEIVQGRFALSEGLILAGVAL